MVAVFVELVARGALEALSMGALLATLWVALALVGLWLGATFREWARAGGETPAPGSDRLERLASVRSGA